jgi:hypothetical protein
VLDAYLDGTMRDALDAGDEPTDATAAAQALRDEEARVMRLLRQRLTAQSA